MFAVGIEHGSCIALVWLGLGSGLEFINSDCFNSYSSSAKVKPLGLQQNRRLRITLALLPGDSLEVARLCVKKEVE